MIEAKTKIYQNCIQDNFSNAASHYEKLSSFHQEIGLKMIDQIDVHQNIARILDVGLGTGWLTRKITEKFPQANVVGIDFAQGMIDQANVQSKPYFLVRADANAMPFKRNCFDLVLSNFAYQWMGDFNLAFRHCYDCLDHQGEFYSTMFGKNTFCELFVSLHQSLNMPSSRHNRIQRLMTNDEIYEKLRCSGFEQINIEKEDYQVTFNDMLSMLKWVKGIGANGLRREFFVGRDLLSRASKYYRTHFKARNGIYATFEVIKLCAKKIIKPSL